MHFRQLLGQYACLRLQTITLTLVACCALWLAGCATAGVGRGSQRKINSKTYVIVGASSGIGRGVAEQLGSYGANVVIAARRTDLLEEVATKIRSNGGKALVVTMDIAKPEDIERLAAEALREYGRVDVWINNAGVGGIGSFWEIPMADQDRIIDVNLKGVIYGSYAAIKIFRQQGYGRLINTGSVESQVPLAYHATYSATKAGIRNFDQALQQELRLTGHKNIRVTTIMPWATDTPFWGHAANYTGKTARMVMMDPPKKVVNAVVWASLHRKKDLPVGWKAKAAYTSHRMAPNFTIWLSGNAVQKSQIKNGLAYPDTSGSVHTPMETGRGIDDGVEKRMKQENKIRKQKGK